jgi:LPS-assembly lipoprotein
MNSASRILVGLALLVLTSCGFHVRGHSNVPVQLAFQSVYLRTSNESLFVEDLRRALTLNKVKVAESADEASITLEIISEATDKQILSLSAAGRVLEYELRYRVSLSAYDIQLNYWLPTADISMSRTMAYDDAQVLAKEQEQALIYKEMRTDAVAQVMRRLSRAQPPKAPVEKSL